MRKEERKEERLELQKYEGDMKPYGFDRVRVKTYHYKVCSVDVLKVQMHMPVKVR